MIKFILALFFFGAPGMMIAQTLYKDMVFSDCSIEKNLSYAGAGGAGKGGADGKAGKREKYATFDLYRPKTDAVTLRPLIIWMHGGGFKFGSKEAAGVRVWCGSFARRGYLCAAIDYQLGNKSLQFTYNELVTNCYRGVQDVRTALAFFKVHAAQWGIDTNRIILAGNSAGGMLALQTVYSTDAEMKRLLKKEGRAPPPADGSADPATNGVAAIVNFWGGIFDTAWLRNGSVPIVSVHGVEDGIVPYDHKGYPLYGSLPIHRVADSLHIPNALKAYAGFSHELQKHFNPFFVSHATRRRWLEAAQFAADFLYKELYSVKPE
jgi:poly(3-hydroxybutyrate) depolymerase